MTAPIPLDKLFAVIHEDNELLVINKPAGLVCHPTKTDEYSSLISRVRLYLVGRGGWPSAKTSRAGAPITAVHLVNRLDRETSGVTLVAKCDDAAREIRRLWENRLVDKEYLAIAHGHVRADTGVIDAPLGKDESSRVAVKDCVRPDGLASQTEFFVEKRFTRAEGDFTLLRVRLLTGRKHQIRIHLAHIGHPIAGDKLYGHDEDMYLALVENRLTDEHRRRLIFANQALHARRLSFTWRSREMEFSCEAESWFTAFASAVVLVPEPL